jgi:hypothetical protein
LESQLERGPTVSDIVNHVNCEPALIVNPNPINERLKERIARQLVSRRTVGLLRWALWLFDNN